jgi:hypothetical protein
MRRPGWLAFQSVILFVTLVISLGGAKSAASADDPGVPDHARVRAEMTGVTPEGLFPATLRISSYSTFGWLNYSSSTIRISFDEAVARKLTCKGPSSFRIQDGRLDSGEVRKAQFISLCHLARGEYEYTVELRKDGERHKLHIGKIVVDSTFGSAPFD